MHGGGSLEPVVWTASLPLVIQILVMLVVIDHDYCTTCAAVASATATASTGNLSSPTSHVASVSYDS